MAEKGHDVTTVDVGYSVEDGKEEFAIRQKGKSRRSILLDRAGAVKVQEQLEAYLNFNPKPRIEKVG